MLNLTEEHLFGKTEKKKSKLSGFWSYLDWGQKLTLEKMGTQSTVKVYFLFIHFQKCVLQL